MLPHQNIQGEFVRTQCFTPSEALSGTLNDKDVIPITLQKIQQQVLEIMLFKVLHELIISLPFYLSYSANNNSYP